ncbi:translation factor GUF1 homolog, mitochondrial [Malaya genurostris]|uniref:translation factor GUF1 homolog, mitochondrial n=1 Tax=Malaya genurostris TaxID=325434 RepID=UPI0026F3DA17|nr:translation factor GUF1 homolog, mitochondrial [Malaya genurostris]XP_058451065.1 translation factor GUF1 homolog, mitochondrial [Malaya genurostris]
MISLSRIKTAFFHIRLGCRKTQTIVRHLSISVRLHSDSVDYDQILVSRIRNFSIIAHVDHGKSTLADRLLELTGCISARAGNKQVLDSLQVEKERGITVKAQTASLLYKHDGESYLLNLIDTPGHVDFSNEVSRSLSACDGVILLVDANEGVQAQTVANFHLAKSKQLVIVPVLNKIDLKNARPEAVAQELFTLFEIDPEEILRISAKLGTGCEAVLQAIVKRLPAPDARRDANLRALIFDSWFDRYRGALNLVYVKDGSVCIGQEIASCHTGKAYEVRSLALLRPGEEQVGRLVAGQVGLLGCNMRTSKESNIGDTLFLKKDKTCEALPGFKPQQPMVFAGVYPSDQSQHPYLKGAIEKLMLNDSAVTVTPDSSPALGQGWRLGFLGLLHLDVFSQRLQQEYDAEPILTAPSVTYKIKLKGAKIIAAHGGNEIIHVSNPALFPEKSLVEEYYEPFVLGTIIAPTDCTGPIIGLCVERRAIQKTSINIDNDRVMTTYLMPLNEIVLDFHDQLKSISSGYASFDYEDHGYVASALVRMDVLLNGQLVEELCSVVHISKAHLHARELVLKLKEMIPRQMVQIAIQAVVNGKVVARETLKAYRKDVTAKLYGGDVTRRMKLLKQQSDGKKKMRSIANINVPKDTFINVLKR